MRNLIILIMLLSSLIYSQIFTVYQKEIRNRNTGVYIVQNVNLTLILKKLNTIAVTDGTKYVIIRNKYMNSTTIKYTATNKKNELVQIVKQQQISNKEAVITVYEKDIDIKYNCIEK